jgi:hypothetical protein
MTWYYALGGQQLGPVAETELREMFRNGRINRDTLVWREGMADWQTFAAARPDVAPAAAANPVSAPCVECGRVFPTDDLVNLNKSWVCAQCKPIFLQRMAEGVPTSGGLGLWRQGKRLVTRSETPFPDRCVKCNAPANGFRLKRVLYWQHPAYYFLLLCNLLILLIVVLIVRKKAVLRIGLCEAHRKQRQLAITACSVGILGGLAMLIGSAFAESGWLALAGLVIFLTGAVWGIAKGRTIAATKIDKENVWVSGICRDFLDQLPERPG